MIIGCTTLFTTLTSDYEIEKSPIGQKLFSFYPTTFKKEIFFHTKAEEIWYVTHSGGGYPLREHKGKYAVRDINTTGTVLIYLKDKERPYLPLRIYETCQELAKLKKNVYLISSAAFTLNQTPIIHTVYALTEIEENDFTYITFEDVNDNTIEVHFYDEPECAMQEEPPDLVAEQMERIEAPGYNELGEDEPLYVHPDDRPRAE